MPSSEIELGDSKATLAQWGPWEALGIGLLAYFSSLFISVIVVIFYGLAVGQETAQQQFSENLVLNLAFMLLANSVMIAVVVAFLVLKKINIKRLGLAIGSTKTYWAIPAGLVVYWTLLIAAFASIEALFPGLNLNQDQEIVFKSAEGNMELAVAFLALIVVAPISEELVYRGFVFQGLRHKFGPILAAVVSSLIFGLVHGQLNVFIDTFILGLVLCWVFSKTKSIWPAIILHALKNGVAFYLLFFTEL